MAEAEASRADVAQLIVNQLRYLDHVVESREIAGKLLEVLEQSPIGVQQQLVACLPELITDEDVQAEAALKLKQLMQTPSRINTLTAPILVTLTNMHIEKQLFDDVRSARLFELVQIQDETLETIIFFRFEIQCLTDWRSCRSEMYQQFSTFCCAP